MIEAYLRNIEELLSTGISVSDVAELETQESPTGA
jgi:hypothetical protein